MQTRFALLLGALTLAGCGFGPGTARYLPDATPSEVRASARVSTVEIIEVTLPSYAASEEISVRGVDGAIRSSTDILWAEDPESALVQSLVTNLSQITGARVAADPWPLADPAQVELTVRIATMLVSADGRLDFVGQYAVAAPDRAIRETVTPFAITESVNAASYQSIADAHARAWRQLSEEMAKRALR
ncbi:PqiC family protein [Litoreibacter roseus]|uniref:Lipoprotein n=1 Tax=Litoreibacter roseus TaxID=2601869 RepID=A0A6N6JIX8_9RHOB|nr:PqiC family protein [Litoreibacter roseus]GFE66074.1 lipoprotein [Litoreibacter roseus]